ncbi:GNAT family N-acetyltransferase [Methanoregula sp. PtaB.Bin085]|uniref:GNAT family N-acetyltransferase n=1 Tax=Methanoregula sp. PtaB.Bin085 TaxID=1811680 RepID=UPI0009D2153A|nr:GNAT family N-acetyltransferase [Methanoregula sp. PtaB.Bin085]OPX65006.1 MAG: Acetyltransferase (GNAT) family protein [Methanoregula sp. PtaB.Bin085]
MTCILSFRIITGDKRPFLPLILCADPEEAVVEQYLDQGTLVAAYCGKVPACVAVVIPVSADQCELKALATAEEFRHRGIASAMIRFLSEHFRGKYLSIIVGTAEPAVSFYEQAGFIRFRTDPGFFTRTYSEPIYDGDFLCRDMIYLRKDL